MINSHGWLQGAISTLARQFYRIYMPLARSTDQAANQQSLEFLCSFSANFQQTPIFSKRDSSLHSVGNNVSPSYAESTNVS